MGCGKADGEDFFLNNNVGVGITGSSLTLTPGFFVKGIFNHSGLD